MSDIKSTSLRPRLYLIPNPRLCAPPHLSPGERVLLFDGQCVLCRRIVQWLIRADKDKRIHLATVQSPAGQDLLRWAGLPTDNFSTIAYIAEGDVSIRSEAFFNALTQLVWPWRLLLMLRCLPLALRDKVYNGIARNRYRWFGTLPDGTMPPDDCHGRRYLDKGLVALPSQAPDCGQK
ncbi:thiol-disulfide oxidoreductase DCC family protein [Biostraticola tofi]|uniref:Putative DCC family thiol-disulfide oxidoreductase YuxK n=1 Tax=Biostraticola tofi TaxID=466109 RepID=A0A4R3YVE8_9GAMM|nr:DCC1-like thiol-disulfide oxidoreductase family protein [Biostraticola tofi]TCV96611.1 putative DCC family thiol-disulfide oxidoreductase YuxK [Biostraticola tofi]